MFSLPKKTKKSCIGLIVEAVSYRIAVQVTEVVQTRTSGCYPVCPRCKRSMEREYMACCDRCGQRLGWDVLKWTDVI